MSYYFPTSEDARRSPVGVGAYRIQYSRAGWLLLGPGREELVVIEDYTRAVKCVMVMAGLTR